MEKLNMEQEITLLKERNIRVESDKAWETSLTRKASIAILTYLVVVCFFFATGTPKPFISALVPTMGFLLSTLSVSLVKKLWIRSIYSK